MNVKLARQLEMVGLVLFTAWIVLLWSGPD